MADPDPPGRGLSNGHLGFFDVRPPARVGGRAYQDFAASPATLATGALPVFARW
jgi:hypothetical protein